MPPYDGTLSPPRPVPSVARAVQLRLRRVRAHPALNPGALEEAWQERGGYPVDPDHRPHLVAAIDWLARAQDVTPDGGIARGYSLAWDPYFESKGWQPAYPETTGYIIPTLYEAARHLQRPDLAARAERAARWELEIQLASGAVRGGVIGQETSPAVFNTGQVLLGWLAAFAETGSGIFAGGARRAACYLLATLDEDGVWRRGNSRFANSRATLLLDQSYLTTAYPELITSGGRDSVIAITYAEALWKGKEKGNRNDIEGKAMHGVEDRFIADGGAQLGALGTQLLRGHGAALGAEDARCGACSPRPSSDPPRYAGPIPCPPIFRRRPMETMVGMAESGGMRIGDPRVMRALAHPARIEIVEHLNDTGEAVTATEVAVVVAAPIAA